MPLLKRGWVGSGQGAKNLGRPAQDGRLTQNAGLLAGGESQTPAAAVWPGQLPAGGRGGILRACANPACASSWLRLWRSRETPVFEGGWCCSPACTLARVGAALRRERDGRGPAPETRRHRVPLGLALLEQGWITQPELRQALTAQRAAGGGRLGEWLVRLGSVSEERVTRALGLQWSCPVLSLDFHHPEDLTPLLPRLFVDAFGALPLRVAAGKILYLGFEDRVDPALALAVERMTGLRVEMGLVRSSLFRPAHERALAARYPAVELMEASSEQALAQALAKALEQERAAAARLVRVHDCLWLRIWRRPQAGPLPASGAVLDLIASTAV